MNIEGLKLNLHNLDAPKSCRDVIAMLEEACAQFECINSHLAKILEKADVPELV